MGEGKESLLCGKRTSTSCVSDQSLNPSDRAFLSAAITLWL
jgi:hypothetical protein